MVDVEVNYVEIKKSRQKVFLLDFLLKTGI